MPWWRIWRKVYDAIRVSTRTNVDKTTHCESGEALTKTCSAGGGGSGDGLKKSGCMGKTAWSFALEFPAAWTAEGARVRNDRRSWAVTLPAEVHVLSPALVLRLRIIVE